MATRLFFPETEAAAVSPTISSSDWLHVNTLRRHLRQTVDASTLTTTAYTPDSSDHIVDGTAHHRQYVSDSLAPQTISGTVKAQFQTLEAHVNNNLFLTLKIYLCGSDGTVKSTLLAITRTTGNEFIATIRNTSFASLSLTSQTAVQNDRIVVEVGVGGLPVATSGTQGHNSSLRFGCSAAGGDLAENNTDTGTTLRPWIEFSANLVFAEAVTEAASGSDSTDAESWGPHPVAKITQLNTAGLSGERYKAFLKAAAEQVAEAATATDTTSALNTAAASITEAAGADDLVTTARPIGKITQLQAAGLMGKRYGSFASKSTGLATGSVTESAPATDAPVGILTTAAALTEPLTATDPQSAGNVTVVLAITEPATATEVPSSISTQIASRTEAASAAETTSTIATATASLTESATVVDALTVTVGTVVSEPAAATDTPSATFIIAVLLSETVTATDFTVAGAAGLVAEAGAASDSLSAIKTAAGSLTEPAAASDASSGAMPSAASISEPATGVDAPTAISARPASLTEPTTADHSQSSTYATPASIGEPITAGESSSTTWGTTAASTNPAGAVDVLAATWISSASVTEAASATETSNGTKPSLGRKTQLNAALWPSRRYTSFVKRIPVQASMDEAATGQSAQAAAVGSAASLIETPLVVLYLTDENGNQIVDENGQPITVIVNEAVDQLSATVGVLNIGTLAEAATAAEVDAAFQITARAIAEPLSTLDTIAAAEVVIGIIVEASSAADAPAPQQVGVASMFESTPAGESLFAATTAGLNIILEGGVAADALSVIAATGVSQFESTPAGDSSFATTQTPTFDSILEFSSAADALSTTSSTAISQFESAAAVDSVFATVQIPFVMVQEFVSAADAISQTSGNEISQVDAVAATDAVSALITAAGLLTEPGSAADSFAAGLFASVAEPLSAQDTQSLLLTQIGTMAEPAAALDLSDTIGSIGAQQTDSVFAVDLMFAGVEYVAMSLSESATADEQMNSFLGPIEKSMVFLSGTLTNKVGLDGKMPRTVQLHGEAPFP